MPAVFALLLLGACASRPPERLPETATATTDQEGVQHATIVGGSYWFRPERVSVKMGKPVELAVSKTSGLIPHSFVMDAPQANIKVDVALETEPRIVRFVPTRVGSYAYYCDRKGLVESHRDRGMVGVLEVTP